MEKIQFKRAELEDKEMISEYLNHHTSRSCERTFVNVYLWSRQYPVKWAVIEDVLVFKVRMKNIFRLHIRQESRIRLRSSGNTDGIQQRAWISIFDVQCNAGSVRTVGRMVSRAFSDRI